MNTQIQRGFRTSIPPNNNPGVWVRLPLHAAVVPRFILPSMLKRLNIWKFDSGMKARSKITTFSFLRSNSFWLFLRQFTTCVWQRAEESCFIIQQLPSKSVCHLAGRRRAAITTNNHGNSTTLHSTMRSSTDMRSTGQMCPQHRK